MVLNLNFSRSLWTWFSIEEFYLITDSCCLCFNKTKPKWVQVENITSNPSLCCQLHTATPALKESQGVVHSNSCNLLVEVGVSKMTNCIPLELKVRVNIMPWMNNLTKEVAFLQLLKIGEQTALINLTSDLSREELKSVKKIIIDLKSLVPYLLEEQFISNLLTELIEKSLLVPSNFPKNLIQLDSEAMNLLETLDLENCAYDPGECCFSDFCCKFLHYSSFKNYLCLFSLLLCVCMCVCVFVCVNLLY